MQESYRYVSEYCSLVGTRYVTPLFQALHAGSSHHFAHMHHRCVAESSVSVDAIVACPDRSGAYRTLEEIFKKAIYCLLAVLVKTANEDVRYWPASKYGNRWKRSVVHGCYVGSISPKPQRPCRAVDLHRVRIMCFVVDTEGRLGGLVQWVSQRLRLGLCMRPAFLRCRWAC